jgi:hypothetical protein
MVHPAPLSENQIIGTECCGVVGLIPPPDSTIWATALTVMENLNEKYLEARMEFTRIK